VRTKTLVLATILSPVLTLQAIVDSNENGLSDIWEKQHNSDELFAETFDPQADPDADGWTNAQEAAAGTDPFSTAHPEGHLQPETTHIPATWGDTDYDNVLDLITPEVIRVSWPTIPGKQYTLQSNPDLGSESWITVDAPFIGTGTIVSYNFVTSAASRSFWRVSVLESGADSDDDGMTDSEEFIFGSDLYSKDGDKDGVLDLEEFEAGTSPVSADTDGDGVSDQDELSNHLLNPLLAVDLDEDGIPDDFEIHFAQQLLNSNPDPLHWGNRHGELLNGDLEDSYDYTDEGVSALEIFLILAESLARNGNSSGFWIEPMYRTNKYSYAYTFTNPASTPDSLYRESRPGDFETIETITDASKFTSGYLSARILNVAWAHNLIPYRAELDPYLIKHFSQSSAGSKTVNLPDGKGTHFQGHIERKRLRLVAASPDHEAFALDCVKVTEETEFWHGKFLAHVVSEPLTLTIPKGKMFSDWIETAAPMGTGTDYAQYIVPCDIVVVFGKGPNGVLPGSPPTTSRAYLEQYLQTVKVAQHGNKWVVRGAGGLVYGIKIAEDENSLLHALSTPTTTVVFDGHANFGLGPNFSFSTKKTIDSFTNFGTEGMTAIPINYRGTGSEPDALGEFLGQDPPTSANIVAVEHMSREGWAYLIPDSTSNQIKGTVNNIQVPHMNQRWKFESSHAISAGDPLAKAGSGMGEFHYIDDEQVPRLIVSAPDSDLPPVLRYKTFFYNACSSGPHFIKNFDHGEFIYTNRTCHVFKATRIFIEGLLNGDTTTETLAAMEANNADENAEITYEVKNP
jgi:hypothetical protein